MNWGHKIVFALIFFGVFIITLVVVCVRQDFYLVSPDYYQEELDFETQIIQTKNAMALPAQPELKYEPPLRELEITFPLAIRESVVTGEIVFFRPSNANQDFKTPIKLDQSGSQKVDLSGRQKGLWRVELSWDDGKKEYYLERKIYL